MAHQLIGHAQVRSYLEQAQGREALAHAYMLRGPEHVGKATLVQEFLARLMCEANPAPCGHCATCLQIASLAHPDVWWLAPLPDKRQVSIDQVRELIRFAQLTSFTSAWRAVVVSNVAELTPEAANALLKILEEPPRGVLFFLLDHHQGDPLPTLRSRCVVLDLGLVPTAELTLGLAERGVAQGQAEELARAAAGLPGVALSLATDATPWEERTQAAQLFISLLGPGGWSVLQQYLEGERSGKGNDETGSQAAKATGLVMVWLEVARDLLLTRLGLHQAVRYQKLQLELQSLAAKHAVPVLLRICQTLRLGLRKLGANANARLTIEWLGVTLPRL